MSKSNILDLSQFLDWSLSEDKKLHRNFKFPDFVSALEFVNEIGKLSEEQGHHPDIGLSWGKVNISLYTHDKNDVTQKDFLLAKKIDKLWEERGSAMPYN